MSNPDEQDPQQDAEQLGATPSAATGDAVSSGSKRRPGNTQEWDLEKKPTREIIVGGGAQPLAAAPSNESDPEIEVTMGGDAAEPEVSVEVEERPTPPPVPIVARGNGNGRLATPPPIPPAAAATPSPIVRPAPPLSETPTPKVETQNERVTAPVPIAQHADEPTSEIEIDDIYDKDKSSASKQPRPVGPPPTPASASKMKAPVKMPPIPASALDSALSTAKEWAEPLSERPRRKRAKPWYEEVFDEDYLRTLPFMTAEQTLREVNFIHESLDPPPGGSVLDVACGYGRHAIELAQRGLGLTGIDLSLPLLIRAADESQRRNLNVNFVHADMREMSFSDQFDGAYCWLTSFGYFDEETNLKVISGIYRALKPGCRFLLEVLNRDYIVPDLPTRVWWEGDGCVVLEEVDFNFHTSRVGVRRSIVFSEGRQLEQDISIRAYNLHELGRLMRQAGFRVLEVSGSLATRGRFFGATSRNMILICEKPPQ